MEAEKLVDHNLNHQNHHNTTSSSSVTNAPLLTQQNPNSIQIESQANQSLSRSTNENSIDKNCNYVNTADQLISQSHTSVYQMVSKPRGFCVIINNVDFDDNKYPKRIGSDEESRRLSNIFTQLYFEVHIKRNQRRHELLHTLVSIAKHNDLKRHDCLVVIILSHGNSGQMIASDNTGLEFEKVLSIFNNQNCQQLIKKPKMFFFNCCRGSTLDFGPQFTVNAHLAERDDDVVDATLWPDVPIISDMMICYSTIDGYVSWRNEQNGTWFGSALATALEQKASTAELNQILTIASENVHNRTTKTGAKQAIEWKYRAWTKALYFNPGYFKP